MHVWFTLSQEYALPLSYIKKPPGGFLWNARVGCNNDYRHYFSYYCVPYFPCEGFVQSFVISKCYTMPYNGIWALAGSTVPTRQTLVSQPHHALLLAGESVIVPWF